MKRLLKIAAVLVLLVAALAVAGLLFLDGIAKRNIERAATHALGVPTTLSDFDVKLIAGSCLMEGLNVANPEGFRARACPGPPPR